MAGPRSTVTSSRRARTAIRSAGLLLALVLLVALAYILGWWRPASTPSGVSVTYITESGEGAGEGVMNSPLTIKVRFTAGDGQPEALLLSANVQLLDEQERPAEYGGRVEEPAPLSPRLEPGVWVHFTSVPSRPGAYHPRIQWQKYSDDEQTTGSITQTATLSQPVIRAKPESGPPLRSGYVFADQSNLWLLSTDAARRRRLTFFPAYYEYAANPAWSPDGTSIAFAYAPRPTPDDFPATDIWSINPDGSGARQLLQHGPGEELSDPAWSPDGKFVYFTTERTDVSPSVFDATGAPVGEREIDRIELAAGERTELVPSALMPSVGGPDHALVYLEDVAVPGQAGDLVIAQRLAVRDPISPSSRLLVAESAFPGMYAPQMSPDGERVVFAAANPARQGGSLVQPDDLLGWLTLQPKPAHANGLPWDLYLVPSSGGQPERLTTLNEDQPHPVWLDSYTIAFMGASGLYKLQITADGKLAGDLTKIYPGTLHGGLSWHGP